MSDDRAARSSDTELLRLVLDSVTDFAIITQDPRGFITTWNRGAEHLLGWTEQEAIGHHGDMMFTAEQRAREIPRLEMESALANGRAEDERWHQRQDGSLFWGSGLMMPLADRDMGFVKIFRDRTRQHEAEALLAESEERFRLLATNIPQLVFRSRGSGVRLWGSPQWEVFTGLSLERSIEFGWLDAIHPDDRDATRAAWAAAQPSREYYVEHRIRRHADGAYRWHQTRAKPIAEELDADDWVGTSADIHDLRTLKDRQEVLMAELQHRTRNLLAVVQAIARQSARGSGGLEEFAVAFETRLRALGRVQGLLAEVDHGDVDLDHLVRLELEAHGEGSPDQLCIAGPRVALPATSAQALALAIHELATNAVKYGALSQPAGRLSISWRLDDGDDEERVVLDWVETGVEMPAKRVRRGYGSELIERALPYQLMAKTRLEFDADGVRCWISAPVMPRRREAAP
jgi:PAS domain S-box-containing protein